MNDLKNTFNVAALEYELVELRAQWRATNNKLKALKVRGPASSFDGSKAWHKWDIEELERALATITNRGQAVGMRIEQLTDWATD